MDLEISIGFGVFGLMKLVVAIFLRKFSENSQKILQKILQKIFEFDFWNYFLELFFGFDFWVRFLGFDFWDRWEFRDLFDD